MEFEQGQRRVPCVTCSGSGVDWRKTCEAVQRDNEALRYDCQVANSVINAQKSDINAQRLRADTAEAERDALKDEVGQVKGEYDRAVNKVTAAEQRIAEQNELIKKAHAWVDHNNFGGWDAYELRDQLAAALNPNPEAESHE